MEQRNIARTQVIYYSAAFPLCYTEHLTKSLVINFRCPSSSSWSQSQETILAVLSHWFHLLETFSLLPIFREQQRRNSFLNELEIFRWSLGFSFVACSSWGRVSIWNQINVEELSVQMKVETLAIAVFFSSAVLAVTSNSTTLHL